MLVPSSAGRRHVAAMAALLGAVAVVGCNGGGTAPVSEAATAAEEAPPAAPQSAASTSGPTAPAVAAIPAAFRSAPLTGDSAPPVAPASAPVATAPVLNRPVVTQPVEVVEAADDSKPSLGGVSVESPSPPPRGGSLDEQLRALQVPPPWLGSVSTPYNTSKPWSEARLEIRRLLGLNQDAARREAIKLTWIYLQKNDIGDGHEYPMYMFLGGEPVWAARAYEEFIAKPHQNTPLHAMLPLASLYVTFGEFDKAEGMLRRALQEPPAPPWRISAQADVNAAFGDLYAAWGKTDVARKHYAEAIRLYPTSNQPYGHHQLKFKAGKVQTRLDLLDARAIESAKLKDGRYQMTSLGYSGDVAVTVRIAQGRIADVQIKHQEKIDQNACVLVPKRIVERQSLQVDSISGATITKDAIVDGVFRGLKQAAR